MNATEMDGFSTVESRMVISIQEFELEHFSTLRKGFRRVKLEKPVKGVFQDRSVPAGTRLAGLSALSHELAIAAPVRWPSAVSEQYVSACANVAWRFASVPHPGSNGGEDNLGDRVPVIQGGLLDKRII
jgi:hypothetical protein